jgi:hypothetical protein
MRSRNRALNLVVLHNKVAHAIAAVDGAVFVGDGDIDYLCGACGSALSTGMRDGDMAGLAFICGCGWSSRVPYLPSDHGELARHGASLADAAA